MSWRRSVCRQTRPIFATDRQVSMKELPQPSNSSILASGHRLSLFLHFRAAANQASMMNSREVLKIERNSVDLKAVEGISLQLQRVRWIELRSLHLDRDINGRYIFFGK